MQISPESMRADVGQIAAEQKAIDKVNALMHDSSKWDGLPAAQRTVRHRNSVLK